MNQINNTLPSGNTTASFYTSSTQTKKPTEEDTKLQQTISSADSFNGLSSTGAAVSQTVSPVGNSIYPAYSVEISEKGTQLNSLYASETGKEPPTGKLSASSPDNTTSSVDDASQTSGATTSSDKSTTVDVSASDTTNLSQYNDSQLKSMLNKGTITQSEYNAEIAKREAKKQTEIANATSTANANVNTVK